RTHNQISETTLTHTEFRTAQPLEMINGIKTICSIALMQFWVDYCVSTPPFHEPSLNYKHLDQPLFLDFPEASEKGTSSDASINSEISDPDFAFGLPFGDRSMNALAEFEEYHRFVFRHYPDADFADPLHEEPWEYSLWHLDGPPHSPYRRNTPTIHPPTHDIVSSTNSNMMIERSHLAPVIKIENSHLAPVIKNENSHPNHMNKFKNSNLVPPIEYQTHDRMNLFDPGSVELEQFAWIHTLEFPVGKYWTRELQLLRKSHIWKIIAGKGKKIQHLPAMVRRAFNPKDISGRKRVLQAAEDLLMEVRLRAMQFFLVCTSPESAARRGRVEAKNTIQEKTNSRLIRAEQDSLFAWLMQQLEAEPAPEVSSPGKPGQSDTSLELTSSLQSMLTEYFLLGHPDGPKYMIEQWGWNVKSDRRVGRARMTDTHPNDPKPERVVSLGQALRTQLAIYLLGNYLKSTSGNKWTELIYDDVKFARGCAAAFGRIRQTQRSTMGERFRGHVQIKDLENFRKKVHPKLKDPQSGSLDGLLMARGRTMKLDELSDHASTLKVPKPEPPEQIEHS
ncbi:hypothetical protein PSHT_12596, partial [Puccinia striiformis]